jgi:hypothetical protein
MSAAIYTEDFIPYMAANSQCSSNPNGYRNDPGFKKMIRSRSKQLTNEELNMLKQGIAEYASKH